jgi:hypothetical protein
MVHHSGYLSNPEYDVFVEEKERDKEDPGKNIDRKKKRHPHHHRFPCWMLSERKRCCRHFVLEFRVERNFPEK